MRPLASCILLSISIIHFSHHAVTTKDGKKRLRPPVPVFLTALPSPEGKLLDDARAAHKRLVDGYDGRGTMKAIDVLRCLLTLLKWLRSLKGFDAGIRKLQFISDACMEYKNPQHGGEEGGDGEEQQMQPWSGFKLLPRSSGKRTSIMIDTTIAENLAKRINWPNPKLGDERINKMQQVWQGLFNLPQKYFLYPGQKRCKLGRRYARGFGSTNGTVFCLHLGKWCLVDKPDTQQEEQGPAKVRAGPRA